MKQYRITTENFNYGDSTNDCVLSDDDPIHEIKRSLMFGGMMMPEYDFSNGIIGKYLGKIKTEPIAIEEITRPID